MADRATLWSLWLWWVRLGPGWAVTVVVLTPTPVAPEGSPRGPEGLRSWSGPDTRSHRTVARARVGPPRVQDSVWEILSGRGGTEKLGATRASGPWRLGLRFTGETWGVRACVQVEKPERTVTQAPCLPQQEFSDGPWKVLSDTGSGRRDTGTCAMLTHVQWEACRDSSPGCRVCLKYL